MGPGEPREGAGAGVSPWGLQVVPRNFHNQLLGDMTFQAGERCDLSFVKLKY